MLTITLSNKIDKNAIKISYSATRKSMQIDLDSKKEITIGVKEKLNLFTLPLFLRSIARTVKSADEKSFYINVDEWYNIASHIDNKQTFAERFAYELVNGAYDFERFKKDIQKQTLTIVVSEKTLLEAVKRGLVIGEELCKARELVNTPGSHLTPQDLALHATQEAKKIGGITVANLDVKKMKALKMNAILAVGESSPNKPMLITLSYNGAKKSDKPIVFVGKGVTFDTGGSNLKPGDHMNGMHMDMAGGAIALHTLFALAKLKVKKNIVCIVPAVENRLTGDSYLPGDVIIGMSGTPIEVLNTDAEGRVILSDALTYAKKYNPDVVIDLATLTGAAVVALGSRASAIFSPDEKLALTLKHVGEQVKNLMWPMPLYDEYREDIKGDLGGITNTHNKFKRDGGSITGAMFLYEFAKDYPWAHIDIAPRMEAIAGDNLGTGATAEPLYALVKFVTEK